MHHVGHHAAGLHVVHGSQTAGHGIQTISAWFRILHHGMSLSFGSEVSCQCMNHPPTQHVHAVRHNARACALAAVRSAARHKARSHHARYSPIHPAASIDHDPLIQSPIHLPIHPTLAHAQARTRLWA